MPTNDNNRLRPDSYAVKRTGYCACCFKAIYSKWCKGNTREAVKAVGGVPGANNTTCESCDRWLRRHPGLTIQDRRNYVEKGENTKTPTWKKGEEPIMSRSSQKVKGGKVHSIRPGSGVTIPSPLMEKGRWKDQRACTMADAELFDSRTNLSGDPVLSEPVQKARAICATCPVTAECLAFGMDDEESGVYGGQYLKDGKILYPRVVNYKRNKVA